MKCIICNNKCIENKESGFFRDLKNYYCINCNVFFYERSKKLNEKINNYYNSEYWDSRRKIEPLKKINRVVHKMIFSFFGTSAQSRYRYIKKYLKDNTMFLEIGIGRGEFLSTLSEKKNLKLFGNEPDKLNCDNIVRKIKKIKVYNSQFEETKFQEKFDFIFMSHVLEHFIDIQKIVLKLKTILNDNSYLFIEVPNNINKTMFNESYKNHPHTIEFSEKSLKLLFEKNGFKIIKQSTHRDSCDYKNNSLKKIFNILKIFLKTIFHWDTYYKTQNGMHIRFLLQLKTNNK